jgi:hypothetical protein
MKKRIALLARSKKRNGEYPFVPVKVVRGLVLAPSESSAFYLRYTENGKRKTTPIAGATAYKLGKFVIDCEYILLRYKEAHEKLGLPLPRFFEPPKPNFLYFIQATLSKRIKIGVAQDVQKRLASLQTGNPEHLELIAYVSIEKSGLTESGVHGMFESSRTRGEWFESTPAMEEFIEKVRNL